MESRIIFVLLALIALVSAGWTVKSSLLNKRSDHTATAWGDYVIVAGGCIGNQTCEGDYCDCSVFTNTAELYNITSNSWTLLPVMPRNRTRHVAAVVSNKLYVFGGRNQTDDLIPQVDVYDPAQNSWSTHSALWNAATSDLAAFVFGNTIYATGGYDASYASVRSVYSFSPLAANPTWTLSAKTMNLSRGDMCASVVGTKAYLIGGFQGDDFCTPLNKLEIYDSVTDSWSLGGPMKHSRGDKACGTLHNRFHIIGGETKDANCSKYSILDTDIEVYDPNTSSFSDEAPLPEGRFRFAAATVGDTLYIFGGQGPRQGSGPNGYYYPVLNAVAAYTEPAPTTVPATTPSSSTVPPTTVSQSAQGSGSMIHAASFFLLSLAFLLVC